MYLGISPRVALSGKVKISIDLPTFNLQAYVGTVVKYYDRTSTCDGVKSFLAERSNLTSK